MTEHYYLFLMWKSSHFSHPIFPAVAATKFGRALSWRKQLPWTVNTCIYYFYRFTTHSVVYSITHTNTRIHMYVIFKKSKIYIKTFKTLLHVSTIRSSSGSIYCSLLNLQFKTFSKLLNILNYNTNKEKSTLP